jgi:hypothetical protein
MNSAVFGGFTPSSGWTNMQMPVKTIRAARSDMVYTSPSLELCVTGSDPLP